MNPTDHDSKDVGRETFDRLAEPLLDQTGITGSTMMGLPCLRVNGAFFASYDVRTGNLLLKLPATTVQRLIDSDEARPFAPAGRTFREWAAIPPARLTTWPTLLQDALTHVRAQPATRSRRGGGPS
jgi:hypothetical protein